ncbi:MAG: aspartate dehydrogenase domain-containing protein [Candidatus Omnitrophota bacterium]
MAKNRLKIGIVGCGAIGTSLAKAIITDFAAQAKLVSLYDIDKNKILDLSKKLKSLSISRQQSGERDSDIEAALACSSLDSLIKRSELVIEAARVKDCLRITKRVLNKGRDIMILSVGGVIAHMQELRNLALNNKARVYIPSGAICGIDALKAASEKKIKKIILLTRKNPKSFNGIDYIKRKGIRLDKIKKDTLLFSGSAHQAIKLFPQNINVAATLSIAGVKQVRVQVKIMACPTVKRNIHELYIESSAGRIYTRVENLLHPDNPKTSFLAVLSTIAALRQILDPVRIGT